MAGNPRELTQISVEASDSRADFVSTFYITISLYFSSNFEPHTCVDGSITCIMID